MEHMLPQPYASHSEPWSIYYAGDSYTTPHHVNGEQGNYQQTYVIAQNNVSHHPPLVSPDTYWPTAQEHTTADPAVSTALPMEPAYFPASCYDNQDLSPSHRHTAADNHFQHGLPGVCGGDMAYGTTNLSYTESDTPATAHSAPTPHPTIAHQTESGHHLIQWDAVVARSALYEGHAATTAFQPTDPSYTEIRPYDDTYATAAAPRPHFTPETAKEERQQTYMAASGPAPDAQSQYVVPAPAAPAPAPVRSTQARAQSPDRPPRGKSPMGHLPYPEEIRIKAESQGRDPSLHRARTQLPSPASTHTRSPTPTPLSPFLQTLTFITYPDTEPRGQRDGRNGGGGGGGGGGTESEEFDDEDDDSYSPPRRGRRGKKEPKKDPFLACFFCRGRKIACHPRSETGGDRTCTAPGMADLGELRGDEEGKVGDGPDGSWMGPLRLTARGTSRRVLTHYLGVTSASVIVI
ncbi:hypothetical protein DFH94DRAFT_684451 [Russula ochroleuca]|uniref:Uncharacterized protein n=1 Tax=Russula ochroleuca TaxID=152965 RepID=A0A9P5MN43_9AGAM|nr:hypothetical protein DFH94DRAFT_684451 [Russula ochroleuca]